MAKTLQSIINKVPPATINNPVFQVAGNSAEISDHAIGIDSKIKSEEEVFVRITAEVPKSVKIQMKERLYKNPDETERTIILKALCAYGFDINQKHLIDQRKVKK
jgi:hypothetical protein